MEFSYDILDDALKRAGSSWDAAQAHGLAVGRLATGGKIAVGGWLQQVLEGVDGRNALRKECEDLMVVLLDDTHRRLSERLSGFTPLLPEDAESTERRTIALAHWCEGFLHGLVASSQSDALKGRLAAEPLDDIIKDMLQITRAGVDEDSDDEVNDEAFTEIVEYVRVAAQLVYEELAELRPEAES